MAHTFIQCPACGAKNRIPAGKNHLRPKCGRCGQDLAGRIGSVVELDDRSFDRIVRESSLPVLVDFYSPSCGPCRMLAPVIDSIAGNFAGRVLVAKLDTSRFPLSAGRFQIKGVPTLLLFKQGKVADQIVGAAPQEQIEQRLHNLL